MGGHRDGGSRDDEPTARQFPELDRPAVDRVPSAPGLPATSEQPVGDGEATVATLPPFVEVELVYETGHPGTQRTWRAVEVWTRNHVYSMEWSMQCVQVVSRQSGEPLRDSKMLGAFLVGGQTTEEDAIEVTYPWPRPGTDAVFRRPEGGGFVTTSTVIRVVLRLRVLTVSQAKVEPTWDDLSGRFDRAALERGRGGSGK